MISKLESIIKPKFCLLTLRQTPDQEEPGDEENESESEH